MITQLVFLIPFFGIAAPAPEDASKKEFARLEGEWMLVRTIAKGKKSDNPKDGEFDQVKISGDQIHFLRRKVVSDRCRLHVDPAGQPPTVDLIFLDEGRHKGKINHAIYRLTGDELWIGISSHLIPNVVADRPPNFEYDKMNDPTAGLVLVFRKAKK